MKAKENVKNNDINLRADTLADLPVTDEQADETKGGAETKGDRDCSDQIQVLSFSWGA